MRCPPLPFCHIQPLKSILHSINMANNPDYRAHVQCLNSDMTPKENTTTQSPQVPGAGIMEMGPPSISQRATGSEVRGSNLKRTATDDGANTTAVTRQRTSSRSTNIHSAYPIDYTDRSSGSNFQQIAATSKLVIYLRSSIRQ